MNRIDPATEAPSGRPEHSKPHFIDATLLDGETCVSPKPSPYLTIKEAAEYLRLSVSKIYKLAEARQLRHRKHGSRLVFLAEDLDRWSREREIEVDREHDDFSDAFSSDIKPRASYDQEARSLIIENSDRRGRRKKSR